MSIHIKATPPILVTLHNVFVVPAFPHNLLSVQRLNQAGYDINFPHTAPETILVRDGCKHVLQRDLHSGATVVDSQLFGSDRASGAVIAVYKSDPRCSASPPHRPIRSPGCSASQCPAPHPCYTTVYALRRAGAPHSEHLAARLACQRESCSNPSQPRCRLAGTEHVPEHLEKASLGKDGKEWVKGPSMGEVEDGGTREEELVTDAQRALAHERMVIRWHQRFAHVGFGSLARLIGLGVEGLKHLNKAAALRLVDREDRCDACAISNLKESSLKSSDSRATKRGDLVHCDLSGPYTGNNEYTYSLSALDDYSRKGWTFPIPDKSSSTVTKVLQRWHRQVETYTEKKVVTLHTDNGTEFDNVAMDTWAAQEGLNWRWTVPGSSEQNGRVERLQGIIQERGRTMLTAARLPLGFWPFAWRYATYIINRTPHRSLNYKIPQELWSGSPVDLSSLRTFGCLCWTMQDARHRPDGKLSARGVRGTFWGISEDRKGWLIYVPSDSTNPLRYSRSVLFDETRTYDEGRSLEILQRHVPRSDDQVEMVLPYPRRRRRKAVEGENTLTIPSDLRDDELGDITKDDDVIISPLPVPSTQTLDTTEETSGVDHGEELGDEVGEQYEVGGQNVDSGRLEAETEQEGAKREEELDEQEGVNEAKELKEQEGATEVVKKSRRKAKGGGPSRKSPRLHDVQALGATLQTQEID
ncbi:hypothetical protein CF327_g7544 [Tilletia walkeri]|nr:hypothetical protein CF327_g7544 [Tilletia walkeri]